MGNSPSGVQDTPRAASSFQPEQGQQMQSQGMPAEREREPEKEELISLLEAPPHLHSEGG